jgi:hypothetical protein
MSDSEYRYGYKVGPFYRKFMAGDNVWVEVNRDGQGGLFFHLGNSFEGHPSPESKPIHFDSEDHFMEFCTKLMGFEALENWEELWRKGGK